MHREDLLLKLEEYDPVYEVEKKFKVSFIDFVRANPNCFERSLEEGHVTGSAWIVNQDRTKVLLTHHKKLDRWLQLGGHADGEPDIVKVATQEAMEESGLESLTLLSSKIFDIDIHPIPARGNDPRHLHYDARFLFEADEGELFHVSSESKNLAWITLGDVNRLTDHNNSISRMTEKLIKR